MKRILIPLALVVFAAAGWLAWKSRAGPGLPVFYGNVDIREVNLGFRVSGRVQAVLKDEGDAVRAGEIIARLDDEPYRHAAAAAEAQAAAAEARLDELKNGSRPEEIAQARAALAAADATLANATLLHDRQRELLANRGVSRQAYDDAEAAHHEAAARRASAQASLDLLTAGTRAEQIAQAAANLKSALAAARMQLADTALSAPEAGVVLTRAVEPGAIVQSGATALSLSLQSPVWIRAYAPEPELGLVHPGREVLVYTDSRAEPYHGKIGDVSPRAEFTPKSVETATLRTSLVYRFRVIVRDADEGLRQGMPVTVKLSTG